MGRKDRCEAGESQDKLESVCELESMLTFQCPQASHFSDNVDLQEKLASFVMLQIHTRSRNLRRLKKIRLELKELQLGAANPELARFKPQIPGFV